MEVYNGGDESSPMLGKFCGKIAPSPIISSDRQLLIKFVSDYETHGAGFSVRYEVFKTGGSGFERQEVRRPEVSLGIFVIK